MTAEAKHLEESRTQVHVGVVKFWTSLKGGYGFVEGKDGRDVYINGSVVEGAGLSQLTEGQLIRFIYVPKDVGMNHADTVKVVQARGN